MNFWRKGVGLEYMLFIARSLELQALPYALNRPPRAAASFNQALHTMTAASGVLARSGVIGAAVMCELGR